MSILHYPKLIAHVFALETCLSGQKVFKQLKKAEDKSYLDYVQIPHVSQVMSVFRLLGLGTSSDGKNINNNLVQLESGEGKSLAIAVTSAVLALLGYNVYCICQNQYHRDAEKAKYS